MTSRPGDPLGRLETITSNLDAYIERRAAEIAAPLVQAAKEDAQAAVERARHETQRAQDLAAELRRQLEYALIQNDDYRGRLGLRRDPYVAELRNRRAS